MTSWKFHIMTIDFRTLRGKCHCTGTLLLNGIAYHVCFGRTTALQFLDATRLISLYEAMFHLLAYQRAFSCIHMACNKNKLISPFITIYAIK